jgi:hypothetical protein
MGDGARSSKLPRIDRWIGATVVVGVLLVASVRAATAEPPQAPARLDDAARQAAFRQFASREGRQRARAERKFPGDAWSQDDDFHAVEMQQARAIARRQRVSLGEVLRALDDGMRGDWPKSGEMKTTVPPCRPRPIY